MVDAMFGDYLLERDGFSRDELAELGRRLRDACGAGRMQILVTEAYLWELAGLGVKDGAKYRRILRTMADLTDGALLASWPTRARIELAEGRTPLLRDAMLPRRTARDIWNRRALRRDVIKWHADAATRVKREHVAAEQAKRGATIAGYEEQQAELAATDPTVLPWRERLFDNPDALIDDWTEEAIERFASEEKIPKPTTGWPAVSDARAFRWRKAIHVARIRGILTRDYSHKSPGVFDLEHLANACIYASTYVTSDDRVARLATQAGAPMRTISFDDWARDLLTA